MSALARRVKQVVTAPLGALGYDLVRRPPKVVPGRFDARLHSDPASLPPEAEAYLRPENPRLTELRQAYAGLDWPVCTRSRWDGREVEAWLHLGYFRGESLYVWHYRRDGETARLYYYAYLRYVLERDQRGLVGRLGEDGAFGCWTFEFPGYPACSRDLLDSVNELLFLDRTLGIFEHPALRVLDIGAGYGRLAHRAAQALPSLASYVCVDAVPESTFLSEYYLGYRGVIPPTRVVALPDVPSLEPGQFDLGINIHSFSECPLKAIEWWVERLAALDVPRLLLVPNEPEGFLSLEPDGRRIDYGEALARHGYRLVAEEKFIDDEATRAVLGVADRFCLFERDR
jgi:SAM-dependent methyltransferase